jgi:hypothetical protein
MAFPDYSNGTNCEQSLKMVFNELKHHGMYSGFGVNIKAISYSGKIIGYILK